MLQSVALIIDLRDGTEGEPASSLADLNQAITVAGVDVRKVTIVAVVVAIVTLCLLALLLGRTSMGLRMRAAAMDFRTARMLGVNANQVIGFAVILSGALAAIVAVILTVQTAARHAHVRAQRDDHRARRRRRRRDRPSLDATLGGFAIGFASQLINGALPTDKTIYLPSLVFALVIVVLLVKPAGALRARTLVGGGPRMRQFARLRSCSGPPRSSSLVGVAARSSRPRTTSTS